MSNVNLHLSVCGHAKCGKSTLAGRIAYELGAAGVTDGKLRALEAEAEHRNAQLGKKDFNKFNLIFLPHAPAVPASRGEGTVKSPSRTVFPVRGSFKVESTRLTLVDTPGHEDFFNNMVYGVYLSDVAVVLVEVESNQNPVRYGAQTVCRLLKAFDVPIAAFCVTKMDRVGYSQDRFVEAAEQISEDLIGKYRLAENGKNIPILPISALQEPGEGVIPMEQIQEPNMPWYEGPSLLEIINDLERTVSVQIDKPLRIAVEGPNEIFSPQGVGTVLVGTLESGVVKPGQLIVAEPISTTEGKEITGHVKSIRLAKGVTNTDEPPPSEVSARAVVSITVPEWSRDRANFYLRHGGVLGETRQRPTVARKIKAHVLFFVRDSVYHGKEYKVQPHVAFAMGRFLAIQDRTDFLDLRQEGYESSESGEWVEAEIEFHRPCCIEVASIFPRLSKFSISEGNRVIACGKCVEIIE